MNFKKNSGFTLVELIVVIAILGLLAGIGIPAYSGYVEKAGEVVDNQQLAMLNNLFLVVCAEAQVSPDEVDFSIIYADKVFSGIEGVTGVSHVISMRNYARGNTGSDENTGGDANAAFATRFNTLMGGPITFKNDKSAAAIKTAIKEGVATGSNVVDNGDGTYTVNFKLSDGSSLALVVNKELADKLKNNNLSALGADVLLGKVDTVAGIASGLLNPENLEKPTSVFEKMLYGADKGEGYLVNLAVAMGIGAEDTEALSKFMTLAYDKNGNPNSSFLANSLVLTAAQKTQGMDTSFLGTSGSAATLRDQLNSADLATSTDAMAKLALTYGMYTSYVNSSYGTGLTDQTEDMLKTGQFSGMTDVLATIENPNFKAYLESDEGKADLAAYQSSMQIVNDAANKSPDAAMDIVSNGFSDPDLVAVLGGLMGNK